MFQDKIWVKVKIGYSNIELDGEYDKLDIPIRGS